MISKNASLSVETSQGPVLTSVFVDKVEPEQVARTLLDAYRSEDTIVELIVRGDFRALHANIDKCGHLYTAGEPSGDYVPECFDSLDDFLGTITQTPYTYNYVYTKGTWWLVDHENHKLLNLKVWKDSNVKTKETKIG